MNPAQFPIRAFQPGDEAAVYDVCLKTGDAGHDATHLYSDPKALGHFFVGPYMRLEPELAFVLTDESGVCGYALGALDSQRFYARCSIDWLPDLQKIHPLPEGDPARWTLTQRMHHRYHRPDFCYPDFFHAYPSHLHIDLLPHAQGIGNGTRMMNRLLDALRGRGSPGVHLSMAGSNHRAEKFYKKLGFTELARVESGGLQSLYLGMPL